MATLSSTLATIRQGFLDYMGYGAPWFRGTTSGNGAADATTLLGAAVMARQPNDRINSWWAYVTSGTYSGNIKSVKDFVASSMTVDVTGDVFGGQILSGVTYELSPWHPTNEILVAINQALHEAYPDLTKHLLNYDLVTGNALQNPGFEDITSTAADLWGTGSGTVATNAATYRTGKRALSVTNGMAQQQQSNWKNLLDLGGQTVYFEGWGYIGVASTLRLGIQDDGGTVQYSDYHTGSTKWELLRKQVTISDSPSTLRFQLYSDTANAALFDDVRVLSTHVHTYTVPKAFTRPPQSVAYQVTGSPAGNEELCDDVGQIAEFRPLSTATFHYDSTLGYWLMQTPQKPPVGRRFRLEGDVPISDLSADTDTVPLDASHLTLLYPLIAFNLYNNLASRPGSKEDNAREAARQRTIYEDRRRHMAQARQPLRVNYGRWNG